MRIVQVIPIVLVAINTLIGNFGGKCGVDDSCIFFSELYNYVYPVLQPLYLFSLFSIPAVVLLPFIQRKVFVAWTYFAAAWVLLSIVFIANAPEAVNSWFQIFPITKETVSRNMGILFSIISILIIVIRSLMLLTKKQK